MARLFRYCIPILCAGVLCYTASALAAADGGIIDMMSTMLHNSKSYIMDLVEHTNTPILRIGIIFVLGLLMSLTPCIYPMIPITLGTLQAAAGKAKHNTFLLSFLYTCGIAITFAVIGMLAAFGGAQVGSLLGSPWFIIPFTIFLGYLGFSMMGLYELRIPRFLQQEASISRSGGAYLSAFVFGMLNGSVASPCVSPGLLMLLSIVAAQQSALLGFVYLFIFGFGLGMPLLIIGTFSNATAIMPQAGIWMLEIKRIFGILLLSMAWYYIGNIVPDTTAYLIAAGLAASIALVYLYVMLTTKRLHQVWCAIIIAISAVVAGFSIMTAFSDAQQGQALQEPIWHNQYEKARKQAQEHNAFLLIDFGAQWCPSCKTIEKQIFNSSVLRRNDLIRLKVDCTNTNSPYVQNMMQTFNVTGLPAVLLVLPEDESIVARWAGELVDYTPHTFLQELQYHGVQA